MKTEILRLFDLEKIVDTFTGFVETKIELIKLDAKEELGALIAKSIVFLLIGVFGLLAVLFLSFGAAFVINQLLESEFLGFLIIGVFYLSLGSIIYAKRGAILEKIKKQANLDSPEEMHD